MPPVTTNYYEGTGFSKVLINKKYSSLLISMSLYFRSENGLIAYLGTKVTLDLSLWLSAVSLRALNQSLLALLNTGQLLRRDGGEGRGLHPQQPAGASGHQEPEDVPSRSPGFRPLAAAAPRSDRRPILLFPAQTLEFTDVRIISLNTGKLKVLVGSTEAAVADAQYSNEDVKEFYVGGVPDALRERWALALLPAFTCFSLVC